MATMGKYRMPNMRRQPHISGIAARAAATTRRSIEYICPGRAAWRRWLGPLLTLLWLWPATGAWAQSREQQARDWLQQRITELSTDLRVVPAKVGVLVTDVTTGKTLASLRPGEQFNIASNAKLITAAAALQHLGTSYRFKTAIFAPRLAGPVVPGDLYLKGYGDPMLGVADLWRMVQQLHDRGVREVRGGVVIDESYFDGQRSAPLFATRRTDKYYRTTNGALSVGFNVLKVRVYGGGAPGQRGMVQVLPRSGYFKVANQVQTTARRRRWMRIIPTRTATHLKLEVRGQVRPGHRGPRVRRRLDDSGLVAGHALLSLLQQRGIKVGRADVRRGRLKRWRRPLAVHYSSTLGVVLRAMNKYSNNFIAEQVLKVLGAETAGPPASWANGLKAVSAYMATIGLKRGSYVMKNGSGLYDATRVTPRQLVCVLRTMHRDFKVGADFVASLPVAGVDGTLGKRFKDSGARHYVRAKTGTLAHVVTLSGYAGAATHRGPVAFAIVLNDLPHGKTLGGRRVADEMAAAVVTYLER